MAKMSPSAGRKVAAAKALLSEFTDIGSDVADALGGFGLAVGRKVAAMLPSDATPAQARRAARAEVARAAKPSLAARPTVPAEPKSLAVEAGTEAATKRSTRRAARGSAPASETAAAEKVAFERPGIKPVVTQAGERGLPIRGREQVRAQHPSKFGVFSDYKTPTPVEETEVVTEPFAALPRDRMFDLSRLEGAKLVSLYGDKERAGDTIRSVGGLPTNVVTHGGAMFPALQEALGGNAAWASEPGALALTRRAIREGLEAGQPVFGVTTTMGPGAVNQTVDMTDLLHQMAQSSPIRKKDLTVFNRRAREVLPGYAGLLDEDAAMQMRGMTQGQRKAFVGLMDNAAALQRGFPNVGAARYALTEPYLVDVPAGASGYSFVELGPESLTPLEDGIPHPSYADRMAGRFAGRGPLVPFDLMFSDFVKSRRAAGSPAGFDLRALELAKPSQVVTPEEYDRLMRYLEVIGEQP